MSPPRPRVAVTVGDPLGIGPEVALRAARALIDDPLGDPSVPVLLGPPGPFAAAARTIGFRGWDGRVERRDPPPAGEAPWEDLVEVRAIAAAARGCLAGDYAAVATAPISKAPLLAAGFPHPGHTEYLGALCGRAGEEVMAFVGGRLRVCLLTTHVPLAQVPAAVARVDVARVITTFDRALRTWFGLAAPRIALCGLNPHAGEGGHLGTEERGSLAPAAADCRRRGIDVAGPLPADSLFARAAAGAFDGVVACYHDQGLVAVKTLDPGRTSNVTLGLPVVRTSPDHGSARDLAGRGMADGGPMEAAVRLAARLGRAAGDPADLPRGR